MTKKIKKWYRRYEMTAATKLFGLLTPSHGYTHENCGGTEEKWPSKVCVVGQNLKEIYYHNPN